MLFCVVEDCIFCQIINKKSPAKIEHEDEETLAFWDINPTAPVHILLVPKKHIASLKELKKQELPIVSKLVSVALNLAKKKGIHKSGFRLLINTGRDSGQIVDHLHLHLLGGWKK